MTYLQFLGLFILPPIFLLLLLFRVKAERIPWRIILLICLVALAYTTPWDNLLILNGVWTYPTSRVINLTFGVVPIEEYSFFVLQTVLVSLFTVALLNGRNGGHSARTNAGKAGGEI